MTEQEKQAVETLTRSFTKMETLYKVKCTEVEAREGEISRLKSENAALRERLSKAVELKAKLYDTIYLPWIYDGVSGVGKLEVCAVHFLMDGSVIYATDLDKGLGEQEVDFLSKYHYGNFSDDDFGVMVFTNKQSAEARLAELKGEKGCAKT